MSEVEAIHRAICAESCAYRGEPPCYTLNGAWPNPDCDEPGCEALAKAAASAMPAAPPAPADVASALRRLGDECWSLVCKDYPIADTGDADVGYEVVSHHQAKPTERREGFGRTPIEALQDAGLLIAAPPAPADESGWDNFGRAPAPSPKPQAYERPPAPADVAGPLDAARKQLLAMSVGGCTCGIKSPDVHFHDARCRYRQAQECLENVEAAAAPPAPADVAGLVDTNKPKFDKTYCSNCGREFGPGDHGYSHCEDHQHLRGKL
jgi:hypothetical protein